MRVRVRQRSMRLISTSPRDVRSIAGARSVAWCEPGVSACSSARLGVRARV